MSYELQPLPFSFLSQSQDSQIDSSQHSDIQTSNFKTLKTLNLKHSNHANHRSHKNIATNMNNENNLGFAYMYMNKKEYMRMTYISWLPIVPNMGSGKKSWIWIVANGHDAWCMMITDALSYISGQHWYQPPVVVVVVVLVSKNWIEISSQFGNPNRNRNWNWNWNWNQNPDSSNLFFRTGTGTGTGDSS